MLECIYHKYYGKKWYSFLCCHTWKNISNIEQGNIIIEKNECIDCGKTEILILVKWN